MRLLQSSCAPLLFVGILLTACGGLHACGRSNDPSNTAAELAPIRLTHSPPVAGLEPQQLRSLSMECQKYPVHGSMRGRYDADYCETVIAAWGDSPLQMVIIDR